MNDLFNTSTKHQHMAKFSFCTHNESLLFLMFVLMHLSQQRLFNSQLMCLKTLNKVLSFIVELWLLWMRQGMEATRGEGTVRRRRRSTTSACPPSGSPIHSKDAAKYRRPGEMRLLLSQMAPRSPRRVGRLRVLQAVSMLQAL